MTNVILDILLNRKDYIAEFTSFAKVDEECILSTIDSKLDDLEDAVLDEVAKHTNVNIILTRNALDYAQSNNRIITPVEFVTS